MIIIGIDPGINGAAAALWPADSDGEEFISDAIDLPTMPDGKKSQIDDVALARWLTLTGATHAVIENVQAMPSIPGKDAVRRSMGAASAFRFGMAAGQIRSTCRVAGLEVILVHPQTWKGVFQLSSDKEESRMMARAIWPGVRHLLERKKDHQRAEAMLIAKWYLRSRGGRNW